MVGMAVIQQLIASRHPQVRWLIARRWPLLRQTFADEHFVISRNDALAEKDAWLRRRWLLALIQDLASAHAPQSRVDDLLKEVCRHESETSIGRSFLSVLGGWLQRSTDYSVPPIWDWPTRAAVGTDDVIEAIEAFGLGEGVIAPDELRQIIDLACLDLDAGHDKSATSDAGEGRYAVIAGWVRRAIVRAPTRSLAPLVKSLALSSDEGVRLAVASTANSWFRKLDEVDEAVPILQILGGDENAWVVREVLQLMLRHQYAVAGENMIRLLSIVKTTVEEQVKSGWPSSEFGTPSQLVVAGIEAA
jgi:hypothetical protein